MRAKGGAGGTGAALMTQPGPPWVLMRALPGGLGLAILLALLFLGVAAGAWPVVRRLTRQMPTAIQS